MSWVDILARVVGAIPKPVGRALVFPFRAFPGFRKADRVLRAEREIARLESCANLMPQGNCASGPSRPSSRGIVPSSGVLKASICYASGGRRRHSRRFGAESITSTILHSCTASRALTNYTTAQRWRRSKLEIGMPRAGTIGVQRMRLQEFGERFGSSNRRLGGMEALSLFGANWASRAGSASNPRLQRPAAAGPLTR